MSHLPDPQLKVWKAREGLSAEALNGNFAALLGLIEVVMHVALTPDAVGVQNEVTLAEQAHRLAALEAWSHMRARERNEHVWTPLAYTASVMQQVRELREPTEAAQQQLLAAHAAAQALHAGHDARLACLEGEPLAATAEEHAALLARHAMVEDLLRSALAQVTGLRQEVAHLRRLAEGHDRIANRREYAPMAMVAHLYQRMLVLEQRLAPEEGAP